MSYRLDHLLAGMWIAFEGDGMAKFRGPDAAEQVAMMQEREWHLREWGFVVARYGWRLARYDRARLAARFRQVIASAPQRPEPARWWRKR